MSQKRTDAHVRPSFPAVHPGCRRANGQLEPGGAPLCEIIWVHGWRIRCCDALSLLLLDSLDDHGPLSRDHVIVFPPREYWMLVPLLAQMGQPLPFAALIDGPFDIRCVRDLFRIYMPRVRKKVAHLDIVIRPVKGYGYLAQADPG